MVLPTKLKPADFRAWLIASDNGVEAGSSPRSPQPLWMTMPSVKDQMNASKEGKGARLNCC
jgi:hypothetical protein